jgi:hypothetical protein
VALPWYEGGFFLIMVNTPVVARASAIGLVAVALMGLIVGTNRVVAKGDVVSKRGTNE